MLRDERRIYSILDQQSGYDKKKSMLRDERRIYSILDQRVDNIMHIFQEKRIIRFYNKLF